jgi:hypothetical protein
MYGRDLTDLRAIKHFMRANHQLERVRRLVAYETMLTVTGVSTGERREPQDARIRLRQAVLKN